MANAAGQETDQDRHEHEKEIQYMAGSDPVHRERTVVFAECRLRQDYLTARHPLPPSVLITTVQHVLLHAPSFRDGD